MSTTAVALVGAMTLPASAAEWNMRVGGFMEQYVAYADSDANFAGDFDGVDSKQDAEIWFLPSITLDNGIKFGANVQLEALTNGDQIDEAHMFIKGPLGEIILGSENSAGYKMTYAAPDVSMINLNSGSTTMFIPWSGNGAGDALFRGTLSTAYIENSRNNDAQRFTYFSPRFSGLQVGASYARDGLQDNNAQVDSDVENGSFPTDIFDFGANYTNSSAVSMSLSRAAGAPATITRAPMRPFGRVVLTSASAASPSVVPTPSRTATAIAAITARPMIWALPTSPAPGASRSLTSTARTRATLRAQLLLVTTTWVLSSPVRPRPPNAATKKSISTWSPFVTSWPRAWRSTATASMSTSMTPMAALPMIALTASFLEPASRFGSDPERVHVFGKHSGGLWPPFFVQQPPASDIRPQINCEPLPNSG
jgi:hypothetical protein